VRVSAGDPPSGVVTFLFTDIEGSTRRWEADAEAMRAAHSIVINPKQPRTEEANGTEAAHPFVGVVGAAWLPDGPAGRHRDPLDRRRAATTMISGDWQWTSSHPYDEGGKER
jgi:hypothetical protein